jgi:hypothetical protein
MSHQSGPEPGRACEAFSLGDGGAVLPCIAQGVI